MQLHTSVTLFAAPEASWYAEGIRLHDTVLRTREWLLERDVELSPPAARADELYGGEGEVAQLAWQAFRAVATEPA